MLRGHETRLTRASSVLSYVTLRLIVRLPGISRRSRWEINLISSVPSHARVGCRRKKSRREITGSFGNLRDFDVDRWENGEENERGKFYRWSIDYIELSFARVCMCVCVCMCTSEPNPVGVRQDSLLVHVCPSWLCVGVCSWQGQQCGLLAAAYIA